MVIVLAEKAVSELKCRWCGRKGETIYDDSIWCLDCIKFFEGTHPNGDRRTYEDLREKHYRGEK